MPNLDPPFYSVRCSCVKEFTFTADTVQPMIRIALEDGRILPPTYRQFTRGYAVTSYGSQGKTVDHVLLSDSAVRAATNAHQWYVTISRGRKSVQIFTPDKQQLRRTIIPAARGW